MTNTVHPSIELLSSVRLLRAFRPDELETLLHMGTTVNVEAHSNVVIEGELTWGVYFIIRGNVLIFKANRLTGESYDVGQLTQGNFFGEMSLVDSQPRSASVKALDNCSLFFIDKEDFDRFISESPDRKLRFYESCLKTVINRLRETDENYVVSQYQLWKTALKKEAA